MKKLLLPSFMTFLVLCSLNCFAEELIHTLQKGETLSALSRKYNVPASILMDLNNIADPNNLKIGQKLRIPDVYVIEKGDTLYAIARKFEIPLDALLDANKLTGNSTIKAGDCLFIPDSKKAIRSDLTPEIAQANVQGNPPVIQQPLEDPRVFEPKKVDPSIIWPVEVKEFSYLTGKLNGVSITGQKGERVKTVASGVVLSTGPYRGFGQVVFIQSKSGYIYVYGGLESISVRPGASIDFGGELGKLGADSLSGKPQLYFMVYNKDQPIDPAKAPRGY
ncbi:M23 family metallopeptidase [Brucepastera parasyntrophica]|uniref:M23 family metallopeptidase n=1 Tax=Brucepastera parasyntrophica TaxID=2880008 RepID=UPI00210A90BB|nr:M23 family metallopeptidase [Brucepastera parasyntrophica]ULQ60197.1 M23 family metallopeptidase [Brucepastera parasyntrophica]